MSDTNEPTRRTGGRSARVQEAVESAALNLLLNGGRARLTMRAVAQEAGVAETTVYRRWPSTDHLTAAALLRLADADADNPIPDTGALADDLHALLTQIVGLLSRPEVVRVIRSAAAVDDETVGEARTAFFSSRFAASSAIVERAVARRELPASADPYRVIEALVAPAYMRALLGNRTFDDQFVADTVAYTLAGARAFGTEPPRA